MKLSKSKVDKLIYKGDGKTRYVAWDEELKGFGCRVYPSGRKAFIVSYRYSGAKRLMTLGDYGLFTVDQARIEAQEALLKIKRGIDPSAVKQSEQEQHKFKDLCNDYLENYAKKQKKTWKEDERRINSHILPKLSKKLLSSLTKVDVRKLHDSIGSEKPYEANRVLSLISTIFEFGKDMGYVDEHHTNPARRIPKKKESKREEWLKPDDIPSVMQAMNEEENIYVRAAFMLYLLTGLRKSELLTTKWEFVDLKRKRLLLPTTKTGNSHTITLSTAAIEVLNNLPKQTNNPYILPSRIEGKHLVDVDKPWRRIRRKAGVDNIRIHDLRRTVGSWLATDGASLPLIGKILNHRNQSTTAIYAKLGEDPAAQALEQHGENIISYASIQKEDKSKKVI